MVPPLISVDEVALAYDSTWDAFTYLVVPPSSTKNLSSSARVIPVPLVAPSTCIDAPDTLSTVVKVASLEKDESTVHQCWDCDSEGEFYETTNNLIGDFDDDHNHDIKLH